MIEAVERLVKLLERENVEWEVFYQFGRSGSFRIERETLERSQRKFYSGIGLRIGLKDRLGFSYITGLHPSDENLERLVKRAVKLAKVSEVPFRGFPTPKKVKTIHWRLPRMQPRQDLMKSTLTISVFPHTKDYATVKPIQKPTVSLLSKAF